MLMPDDVPVEFLGLELTKTKAYWRVLNRDEINISQEDKIRNNIFRHTTSKDYQKRPALEAPEITEAAPKTRRKFVIDEQNQSVKFIKQMAEKNFQQYEQSTDREKHFIMYGLNNVFELTDDKQDSHLHNANEEQKQKRVTKSLTI
ncbi:hypothetical protein RMATCC62417_15286 [Rhizopus microsporus]|nr:hypothetical protein RMATCC62417_15286 [Rhizopus microsporus]